MLLFALLLLALLPGGGPVRVERRVPMMGTVLELVVEAPDRPAALAASEAAVRALEATEERLSTWRPDSELARLNRAPAGEAVALSPELRAELAGAADCRRRTGGAFDPGIGALLAAWDVRGQGRLPAPVELRAARAAGGLEGLELGPGVMAVRRRPGLVIDEGGFGKGAGLDRAVEALAAAPHPVRAFLDLGGQIAVAGAGRWQVAVAHPRRRERPVLTLELSGGSVATSGTSERGAHLLDPRSGRPARDFGSLTVLAPTGLEADCLATGLYVLGPEAALAWGEAAVGVEVLVLAAAGEGLRARATSGLAGRLTPLVPEVSLELPRAPSAASPSGSGCGTRLRHGFPPPRVRSAAGALRAGRPHPEPPPPTKRSSGHFNCDAGPGFPESPGALERITGPALGGERKEENDESGGPLANRRVGRPTAP